MATTTIETDIRQCVIDDTKAAMEEAFRYAKEVPEDKIDWKPMDEGRSVLNLCRELAASPKWAADLVQGKPLPEFTDEMAAAIQKEQEQWKSVAACETECKRRLEVFYHAVEGLTDDDMKTKTWLPFSGGRDFTMLEMMDYLRWNFNYHLGQIAYIQTLYGDKEQY